MRNNSPITIDVVPNEEGIYVPVTEGASLPRNFRIHDLAQIPDTTDARSRLSDSTLREQVEMAKHLIPILRSAFSYLNEKPISIPNGRVLLSGEMVFLVEVPDDRGIVGMCKDEPFQLSGVSNFSSELKNVQMRDWLLANIEAFVYSNQSGASLLKPGMYTPVGK